MRDRAAGLVDRGGGEVGGHHGGGVADAEEDQRRRHQRPAAHAGQADDDADEEAARRGSRRSASGSGRSCWSSWARFVKWPSKLQRTLLNHVASRRSLRASTSSQAVLDRAAGGVDADVGVRGLLVGRGDAGELRDLAAPGLGVEALAVAALALLERGGHVHQEERAAGLVDHRPDLLAGRVERRDRAADRHPAVPGDLGGHPADPADVGLAVLAWRRSGPARQVPAYDVAVEAGDRALALLEEPVHAAPGRASTCRCRRGR